MFEYLRSLSSHLDLLELHLLEFDANGIKPSYHRLHVRPCLDLNIQRSDPQGVRPDSALDEPARNVAGERLPTPEERLRIFFMPVNHVGGAKKNSQNR